MTYYFIDDFDNICRQKDGMDKDFAEVIDLIELINDTNKIQEENEQLKGSLYAEKTNTAEVTNEYSKQFKRHSKEFSFMIDLAEDLGVDVSKLEAKDD